MGRFKGRSMDLEAQLEVEDSGTGGQNGGVSVLIGDDVGARDHAEEEVERVTLAAGLGEE